MWKTLVVGALAWGGFAAWESSLEETEADRRALSVQVRRLVDPEAAAQMRVAGVTVERGGQSFLYVRTGGLWRCLTGYGAPRVMTAGDGALIEGVRISYGTAAAPGGGGIHCITQQEPAS